MASNLIFSLLFFTSKKIIIKTTVKGIKTLGLYKEAKVKRALEIRTFLLLLSL
jgi:hypothetical protein